MGPVETSEEMYSLMQKVKFHSINVAIVELIGRVGKTKTVTRLNNCYRDVVRELNVPFVNLKKLKSHNNLCSDGLHPSPTDSRQLASDFRRAIKHTEIFYSRRRARLVLKLF